MYKFIIKVNAEFDLRSIFVRARVEPSRSCCISVDVSMREKRIGTIPTALFLFFQNLEAKHEFDLM